MSGCDRGYGHAAGANRPVRSRSAAATATNTPVTLMRAPMIADNVGPGAIDAVAKKSATVNPTLAISPITVSSRHPIPGGK